MDREISHGNGFIVQITFKMDLGEKDNVLLGKAREEEDSGLIRLIRQDIKLRKHGLTSIADMLKCVCTGECNWGIGER